MTLLSAREPEAGAYPVVVAPGWGGVMVHECFGHSMEGDGIRKRTSIRAEQRGQQVAARGVTIVDSGIVPYSRGSFRVDDEGTPAQRTVLVEDGILVGYLWDLLNARIMNERPTGNGRRASYRDVPLCRMTNTYIEGGSATPDDLIAVVQRGLYCKSLGGGSVNPADGNFSFQVTEACRIENGKLTAPGAQRDADRQRQRCDAEDRRRGDRSAHRRHHRIVRQERTVETVRRRPADGALQRDHGGRDGHMSAFLDARGAAGARGRCARCRAHGVAPRELLDIAARARGMRAGGGRRRSRGLRRQLGAFRVNVRAARSRR